MRNAYGSLHTYCCVATWSAPGILWQHIISGLVCREGFQDEEAGATRVAVLGMHGLLCCYPVGVFVPCPGGVMLTSRSLLQGSGVAVL